MPAQGFERNSLAHYLFTRISCKEQFLLGQVGTRFSFGWILGNSCRDIIGNRYWLFLCFCLWLLSYRGRWFLLSLVLLLILPIEYSTCSMVRSCCLRQWNGGC